MVTSRRGIDLGPMRAAQAVWAATPMEQRLRLIKRLRHTIAARCRRFSECVDRPETETLTAEVLPLLEACRFLEQFASGILEPKYWRSEGRPLWLSGVRLEVRREPLGVVLIIGPSNYPLFLAAAQAVQALAAGNAVAIKPGRGGARVAGVFLECLMSSGFDQSLVSVLGEEVEEATAAIESGVDKVILTGSFASGTAVLRSLAHTATPAVMELSGDDPVFVREDADLGLVVPGLEFALRLNGGNTCIAPKRVFVTENHADELRSLLLQRGIELPVISVMNDEEALTLAAQSPFALGAVVFGKTAGATSLAKRIRAGTVVVNDVIVPTADPRLPFGGRGSSGFGVTRGAEGLLEMTAVKAITVRSGRFRPHYRKVTPGDIEIFTSCIGWLHGKSFPARVRALAKLCSEVMSRRNRVN